MPVAIERPRPLAMIHSDNPFWTWQKAALVAAVALAVIGVAGFKTGYLPAPASLACGVVSLVLVSAVAVDALIERARKQHVEPLDPKFLHFLVTKVSLGLRCVQNEEQAAYEQESGVFGDSLNLDPSAREVWKKFHPDDKPNDRGYTDRDLFLLNPKWVPLEKQQMICSKWEQGVDDFIRVQIRRKDTPTFLLANYPDDTLGRAAPYDLDAYGLGLGKKGKQQISKDNILSVIHAPSDPTLTEDERVRYYRSSLIQQIALASQLYY